MVAFFLSFSIYLLIYSFVYFRGLDGYLEFETQVARSHGLKTSTTWCEVTWAEGFCDVRDRPCPHLLITYYNQGKSEKTSTCHVWVQP